MKKCLLLYFLLNACNQAEDKSAAVDLKKLSSILSTANWRVTSGVDTSYIYFSRQFDNSYSIHEYKLIHGDSSVTWRGSIYTSGDSVIWSWNNHSLWLQEATHSKAHWKEENSGENYLMQKINDSSVKVRSSDKELIFKRTLPLSTFLVRAKYDYEHGTRLIDSAEVPFKN